MSGSSQRVCFDEGPSHYRKLVWNIMHRDDDDVQDHDFGFCFHTTPYYLHQTKIICMDDYWLAAWNMVVEQMKDDLERMDMCFARINNQNNFYRYFLAHCRTANQKIEIKVGYMYKTFSNKEKKSLCWCCTMRVCTAEHWSYWWRCSLWIVKVYSPFLLFRSD